MSSRVLSTLYPASCAACDRFISPSAGMCELCLSSCEPIGNPCPTCAQGIAGDQQISCRTCVRNPPPITTCTAIFEYGGQLALALRKLKYSRRNDIARSLRPLLQEKFSALSSKCDVAIAIPLHRRRLRKRGFNQAQRLLLPLASEAKIRVDRSSLVRTKNTQTQASLSRSERAQNLRAAFAFRGTIGGKKVLLLDDVRTTGSTLHSAARVLQQAGAAEIHCFVAARA